MLRYLLAILFMFSAFAGQAQKTALEKAVDSTCKCINIQRPKITSKQTFNELVTKCIMQCAMPYMDDIAKEENITALDEDDGEKIGQKIGMKLAVACPSFLELIAKYEMDDKDEKGEILTGTIKGTITDVTVADYVYLHVKDGAGKITKILWLDYFSGSDDYKENPTVLKGKTASLEWSQIELYAVKQKDFVTVKKITKLEVK